MGQLLAILGGEPVITENIFKPWPTITEADKKAVCDVLDAAGEERLWGGSGPSTTKLQDAWSERIGRKHTLLTNSGTAALHTAVAAAGIEPGDEVITSAFTFVASATCILHHNAIPVFADVDLDTFDIAPASIEAQITDRTRALIPVHIHGLPADMDPINEIARRHNLVVIEDACQAHGATYHGRPAGALGDMACFSLNGIKHLIAPEGGLFCCDDEEQFARARLLQSFGEFSDPNLPREYNARSLGWMYRSTEINAALAYSQLQRLDEYNAQRQRNAAYLHERLSELPGVVPTPMSEGVTSAYWLFAYRVPLSEAPLDDVPQVVWRETVAKALNAEGVPTRQWQTRVTPAQSLFQTHNAYGRGCPWDCPHGRRISYDLEQYPNAQRVVEQYLVLWHPETVYWNLIGPPNGLEQMSALADGFDKVCSNLAALIPLAREAAENNE